MFADKDKKEVIKELFDEMCECGLFIGKYDARNGDNAFMYGIQTVMEYIAYRISDEVGDEFSEVFVNNLIESNSIAELDNLITNK